MERNLNTRKKVQYLDPDVSKFVDNIKTYSAIQVVYKDARGLHEEEFVDKSIEKIKAIYDNFNNTLKPDETKRTPLHFFKKTIAYKYEKLDGNTTL